MLVVGSGCGLFVTRAGCGAEDLSASVLDPRAPKSVVPPVLGAAGPAGLFTPLIVDCSHSRVLGDDISCKLLHG